MTTRLLTGLLRDRLGFTGIVVADYFAISFLEDMHGVAGSPGEAGARALRAGVDVELPAVRCYGEPLIEMVRDGAVPEECVDRAVARVLALKCELGLLDPADRRSRPGRRLSGRASGAVPDLDPPELRDLARRLAEESIVLLANDGTRRCRAARDGRRRRAAGRRAARVLGCYSFPNHMGMRHPDLPLPASRVATLLAALRAEGAGGDRRAGLRRQDAGHADIAAAVAARVATMCVRSLGDRPACSAAGTSGEGCDAESCRFPAARPNCCTRC